MISIILTVFLITLLIVILKFFDKFKIDNSQALVINYYVAGFCGIYFSRQSFSLEYVLNSDWIFYATIIGALFIIVFNAFAIGTQKIGIALATIANKLSLFIPVIIAVSLYPNEHLSFFKVLGLLFAIIGIYLSATQNKKLSFDKKYLFLIILIFIGQGTADALFNHAQLTSVKQYDKEVFVTSLFLIAGISGTFFIIFRAVRQQINFEIKNLVAGIILGIPNYVSLIFFYNSLKNSGLESSQVFPIVSVGLVISSAFIGLLVFREKLTIQNWIGIVFSIIAILAIAFL